jgi:hypothetical protein
VSPANSLLMIVSLGDLCGVLLYVLLTFMPRETYFPPVRESPIVPVSSFQRFATVSRSIRPSGECFLDETVCMFLSLELHPSEWAFGGR